MSPNLKFRLSTCIKAGRRGAPNVAKGWAARWLPRRLQVAWVVEVEAVVAGLGSVCWETEVAWAV
jgi:hypothetical protein